jgi:hypothetical protein
MEMQKFLADFEEYCITPGVESGKARSYAKAIEYLCDYLNITVIDAAAIAYMKTIENDVKDKNSALYKDLLVFLSGRGQKSYLTKGWIRAALKHFFDFV